LLAQASIEVAAKRAIAHATARALRSVMLLYAASARERSFEYFAKPQIYGGIIP
jgi:hypothetical protein